MIHFELLTNWRTLSDFDTWSWWIQRMMALFEWHAAQGRTCCGRCTVVVYYYRWFCISYFDFFQGIGCTFKYLFGAKENCIRRSRNRNRNREKAGLVLVLVREPNKVYLKSCVLLRWVRMFQNRHLYFHIHVFVLFFLDESAITLGSYSISFSSCADLLGLRI